MFRRKFEKCKTHENWIRYKTHRNQVSYLRRKSLQLYIKSRCNQSAKGNGKEFWTTIKPLISFKNKGGSSNITLLEGGKIINNPVDVGNILNKYYVSATENIGLPDKITGNASLNDITKLHDNKECKPPLGTTISKGCPQGSLFGPLAYNIFSNDLLLSIQNICDIYNYADDNSIGYSANTVAEVTDKLNSVASLMMEWFESNSLQANPNKFQFIIHSPNNALYDSMLSINNNVQLKPVAEVKLLGVTFDSKLTFTKHINNLCIKAGRHINALSRLSNVLSKDSKQQLFQTFILSNFNFCPVVWHFCGMAELKQIEKVQKRALKIIYNDFNNSYVNLRENANRPLMYVDRLRYIVIEIFKIYHGMSPIYLSDLVAKTSQMYKYKKCKVCINS